MRGMIASPRSTAHPSDVIPVHASRLGADLTALGILLGVTAVIAWDLVAGGVRIGLDSSVFFYPMFHLLGDRLAAGDLLPGWNPHQFAGVPLAADPQSGWGYLLAMLLFALLPLTVAAPVFAIAHLALAGFGVYAFARNAGIGPVGALTAAVAFEGSGFFRDRAVCCFAHVMVAAWLPLLLLGVERAVRTRLWPARLGWWGLAGAALSQTLAGWLGQGSYYAIVLLGAYLVYRTVLAPPELPSPIRSRVGGLLLHGGGVLGVGFGLAAAGLLPRLEYNGQSTLEGGYTGAEAVVGGFLNLDDAASRLLGPTGWYIGGSVAALALAAPLLARGRRGTLFWGIVAVGTLVISSNATTPLHQLFYLLLPRFEALHRHYPDRALLVLYLALALLAGIAVDRLAERPRGPISLLAALTSVASLLLVRWLDTPIPRDTVIASVTVVVLLGVWILGGSTLRGIVVPAIMVLVVAVDLFLAGRTVVAKFPRVDLASYYQPGSAGDFLTTSATTTTARFFGFAPHVALGGPWPPAAYRYLFNDPGVAALLVNDRATVLGLDDLQGYNPLQLQRFADLLLAVNGTAQEYREANVLPAGVSSPLLDLLGVRYAVVMAAPPDPAAIAPLFAGWTPVFADTRIRILENPDALPRAWLVHQARRVDRGGAIAPLATGAVDPRQVALVEGDIPELWLPANLAAERVMVVEHGADQMRLAVDAQSPGILMIGEAAYPGWRATVDGVSTPVLTADHLLRAIAVPAGRHTIELRFESRSLEVGAAISVATLVLLLATIGGTLWFGRKGRARRSSMRFKAMRDHRTLAHRATTVD